MPGWYRSARLIMMIALLHCFCDIRTNTRAERVLSIMQRRLSATGEGRSARSLSVSSSSHFCRRLFLYIHECGGAQVVGDNATTSCTRAHMRAVQQVAWVPLKKSTRVCTFARQDVERSCAHAPVPNFSPGHTIKCTFCLLPTASRVRTHQGLASACCHCVSRANGVQQRDDAYARACGRAT